MAFQKEPSQKWQDILNMTDEEEQGKAATEYVMELESEIQRLKTKSNISFTQGKNSVIDSLMHTPEVKEWLAEHDKALHHYYGQDWSGLQGGF